MKNAGFVDRLYIITSAQKYVVVTDINAFTSILTHHCGQQNEVTRSNTQPDP